MQPTEPNDVIREVDGTIQQVDPLTRDLRVRTPAAVLDVDVPPDCRIFLNGEPVKLRLLQPLDRAHIQGAQQAGRLVAQSIQVSSAVPAPGQQGATPAPGSYPPSTRSAR